MPGVAECVVGEFPDHFLLVHLHPDVDPISEEVRLVEQVLLQVAFAVADGDVAELDVVERGEESSARGIHQVDIVKVHAKRSSRHI